jgi:hypothetical protein
MPRPKGRISRRRIGSLVFSVIDFNNELEGEELETFVRQELENWLMRFDGGYDIYGMNLHPADVNNGLGEVLVVHATSYVDDKSSKLVKDPDLWEITITQRYQGRFRYIEGRL